MKNEKLFILVVFLSFLFTFLYITSVAFAESSYVLPYPSFMPGTFFYKVDKGIEFVEKYWYFGDFGKFTFSLKESDKYLVEAKTLFEYKQYLLAEKALQQSNIYFLQTGPALKKAAQHGKNILEFKSLLASAADKHEEVLKQIEQITPDTFIWSPEKTAASTLEIHKDIEEAIQIRKSL